MTNAEVKNALYNWLSSQLGTRQVFTITLDADLVAGNTFQGSLSSVALPSIVFATGHDETMEAICYAYNRDERIFRAVVTGAREITVTLNDVGINPAKVFLVTGGATQANAVAAQTVAPINVPVIFSDQNAPRPSAPYAVIRMDTLRKIHSDEIHDLEIKTGIGTIVGERVLTVSINYFGAVLNSVVSELSHAADSLQKPTVYNYLAKQGMAIVQVNNVQNLTSFMEEKAQPRAFFDCLMSYLVEQEDKIFNIESVRIHAEIESGNETLEFDSVIES